jgi:hypothetical protein
MNPDLEKLRRFALAIGLILITYSLAAVKLDMGATIEPLGFPLKVNRPEYLDSGLVIASLWGMGRFLYYGVWKTESPPRKRKKQLKQLRSGKPTFSDNNQVEEFLENFRQLFPRIPGFQITAKRKMVVSPIAVMSEEHVQKEHKTDSQVEMVIIPWPLRVAARIEDIDYFAPIWLNVIALGRWFYLVASVKLFIVPQT